MTYRRKGRYTRTKICTECGVTIENAHWLTKVCAVRCAGRKANDYGSGILDRHFPGQIAKTATRPASRKLTTGPADPTSTGILDAAVVSSCR